MVSEEPGPAEASIQAAITDSTLSKSLFKLLPPILQNADTVQAAMTSPMHFAKLQELLVSEKDNMDPRLHHTLFGPTNRYAEAPDTPEAVHLLS